MATMSESTTELHLTDTSNLFTCISCSFAFSSAEEQRLHYRADHHRYNMKRRVAGLPPVSASLFNQKVLERKAETAIMSSAKGSLCSTCRKTYTTENAYRSHLNSKKHKEAELNATSQQKTERKASSPSTPSLPSQAQLDPPTVNDTDAKNSDEPDETTIEERIASARSHINPTTHCLFCPATSAALSDNLTHMSTIHSFFIPDAEYLVDLSGLLNYLGEKIALEHICISCNGRSREFRSLEAVRKHMSDKGHCKIAYDAEKERLEISDFYDFTSSYPQGLKQKKPGDKARTSATADEWEDIDDADDDNDDDEVVEVVDESSEVDEDSDDDDDDDDEESDSDSEQLPDNQLTYGDTPYELVLPSGARIGHRSLRRYYAQSFARPLNARPEDPNSGAALVRKLISDRNSALVPMRGGFGAFGKGTEVVKARNRGEAREAGRHIREFRDQTRREHFKTKVGFRNNYQKHFRDPLLQ